MNITNNKFNVDTVCGKSSQKLLLCRPSVTQGVVTQLCTTKLAKLTVSINLSRFSLQFSLPYMLCAFMIM